MKKLLLVLVPLLLLSFPVMGKGPDEKAMRQKAQELTYEGQMERAQELLGKEGLKPSSGGSEGGWTTTSIVLGLLWGSIGTGYFMYGKKEGKALFLLCGIGLCVMPLFLSSDLWNLVLGVAMVVVPFKVDF